jgi:hypothetical protein
MHEIRKNAVKVTSLTAFFVKNGFILRGPFFQISPAEMPHFFRKTFFFCPFLNASHFFNCSAVKRL